MIGMNKTLPSLMRDKLSFDSNHYHQHYDIKILEKIKSNIFYKVFKLKTDNSTEYDKKTLKKPESLAISRETLYEKITNHNNSSIFSLTKQKEKKIELNLKQKEMIYKLKEKQKSGFELTKENANLLLDTINFVIREKHFNETEVFNTIQKNLGKFIFCENYDLFKRIKSIFSEIELPETLTYKEIAFHLIDFIENFLTMEKIYKVSQVNNDISVLRKELFEKSEEVEKLKSNDKMKVFLSLEEENQKLQKMFDNLQKESSEFHIQIKNIKDLFDDIKNNNNDKESINLEFVSLNIKYLEITEDIKLRNSTIEKLKHICNEERSIKESYIMKAKGVQDNLDKLELKTKALEKINENYRIEREEDSYAENIKFKNPSLSKKTPSKKMFAKDNRNVENINLNYFSKSLQK